jgi:hypothetical protein
MDDREAHLLIIRSASRTSKRRLRNFERTSPALRASPPNLRALQNLEIDCRRGL